MKSYVPIAILSIAVFMETYTSTYLLYDGKNIPLVCIAYFVSGIVIGLVPMFPISNQMITSSNTLRLFNRINCLALVLFFIGVSSFFIWHFIDTLNIIHLDYHYSDNLPQIKVMCQRFLHCEKIYAPIQEIWNGKKSPYMPLMWLPFSVAEFWGIDMRWTCAVFILVGIFFVFRTVSPRYGFHPFLILLPLISLSYLFSFISVRNREIVGITEESIVIGFYLFMCYALVRNNPWLIGLALACCLLSRFVLFFWAPVYIVYVFLHESKSKAITISLVSFLIIAIVFLIPFGFSDPKYFLNIPSDYHVGVDTAWNSSYENGVYYGNALGYAKWFDISQIQLLHNMQIIVAAILPVILLIIFHLIKNRITLNKQFWSFCSLKICLVFFYNMLEVPYYYLFFTSTFFSYAVLFAYLRLYDFNNDSQLKTNSPVEAGNGNRSKLVRSALVF